MKENKEKVKHLKGETTPAKSRLIEIYSRLLDIGEIKEAEALEKIIIRLEVWQNK